MTKVLKLKISAYTPQTIPMNRLAEYMKDFALLLGEFSHVHFKGMEAGSTVFTTQVELKAFPYVIERIRNPSLNIEVSNAFKALNKRLREDKGDGVLLEEGNLEPIASFRGVHDVNAYLLPSIVQSGTLDGIVIRLGGKGANVPVTLEMRDGTLAKCEATRELARKLAHHLFITDIRCFGNGKWNRSEEGAWILESFRITNFDCLSPQPLDDAVADLRHIEGSMWAALSDPWGELNQIRGEE